MTQPLLTDAQLAAREAAWASGIRDIVMADILIEQEPALIARLRSAERLLFEVQDTCEFQGSKFGDRIDAHFAEVEGREGD